MKIKAVHLNIAEYRERKTGPSVTARPIIAKDWLVTYLTLMPIEFTTVTMNVSLPEPLKQYVDDRVSSGIYGSASEFVREAIREKLLREQNRAAAKAELAGKLLEGLGSGKSIRFTDDYIADKKSVLTQRAHRKINRS